MHTPINIIILYAQTILSIEIFTSVISMSKCLYLRIVEVIKIVWE